MSLPFLVLPEATAGVKMIFRWYEKRQAGLGWRFQRALQTCYEDVSLQKRKGEYRHALVEGFPYRVVYVWHDEAVVIYQVHHTNHKPNKRFGP